MNTGISPIEQIMKILISNQNNINYFRNSSEQNTIYGINNFLNSLEIDIKTIFSLLERIKFDISQNMNKDIIICGNCDCCNYCNCSTNNCSENQINFPNDYKNKNEYIKEIINQDEKNDNDFNIPLNNNANNYNSYQYLNPNYNNISNYNKNNNNPIHNLNIEPIKEKFKNSAVMKSKRFQVNKSLDNLKIKTTSPIRKAKIIRHFNLTEANNKININNYRSNKNIHSNQKNKKISKISRCQKFLNKLHNQPKEIISRFKNVYGNDIEMKLKTNEINNVNLNEMENILNKIIDMSIWGKDEKGSKKKFKYIYNPIQEKVKLKQALTNKQALYKEYPRGWHSTKEYFINNGTAINNDNAFV